MSDLLLDTDAVSILFKPGHNLYGKCFSFTSGHHLLISFMTQAELMLWPRRNKWGATRIELLRNSRKTGRVRAALVECSFAVWRRGTAPFALLRNTRKTGRVRATFTESSFIAWWRETAPFALLMSHVSLFTTLYPDEHACAHWADVVSESNAAGRPIGTADAWIAACARQWGIPLVTANFRDFEYLRGITLAPLRP